MASEASGQGTATVQAIPSWMAGSRFVALYLLLLVLLWSALPAWFQSVPHADNVEQLAWAHSWEWGYVKHPPLPTWLLRGAVCLFGPSAVLTYALAMACVAAALALLWRAARELLDARAALLVLLLSSANYYLMGRGSFLNHNTVMLPFVAGSAWAVLRIGRDAQGAAWQAWLLLGLAQALGMLTKYQMAPIIAANALALAAQGVLRQPRPWRNAALAVLATVLPLWPHLRWLQAHEFSTFTYAGQSLLADLPALERVRRALGFLLQQLGRFAPAIAAAGLAAWIARRAGGAAAEPAGAAAPARDGLRAVALLALFPLAAVLALTLFAGVAPQNHWGASTTLLLPLLAVAAWPRLRRVSTRGLLAAVLAVQLAAAAWFAAVGLRSTEFHFTFPARALAAASQAYWSEHSGGRLAIIAGPDWEVGAISLELATHPDVLASGDRRQAPWVDDQRLGSCGALVFWRPGLAPAQQLGDALAAHIRDARTLQAAGPHGTATALEVGFLAPEGRGCD